MPDRRPCFLIKKMNQLFFAVLITKTIKRFTSYSLIFLVTSSTPSFNGLTCSVQNARKLKRFKLTLYNVEFTCWVERSVSIVIGGWQIDRTLESEGIVVEVVVLSRYPLHFGGVWLA